MVMTPSVFAKYMQDDIAKWAHVIKIANIKATVGIHVIKTFAN